MPSNQDIDNGLMLRVRDNDQEAFRKLFHKYHREIVNFFHHRGDSRDLRSGEDQSQEVFLRLWRSRRDYKPIGMFRPYLFSIAFNLWRDQCRMRRKKPVIVSLDGSKTPGEQNELPLQVPDGKAIRPYEVLAHKDESTLIKKALRSLPAEQKEVLLLRDFQGLSYREISSVLRCPVGTICSRRRLAISKLAAKLKELKWQNDDSKE